MCDIAHAVEAMFGLPPVLTASGNLLGNMSDARETAIFSFTGITHISEKISRCYLHMRKVKYSFHIVYQVTYSNSKAKDNNLNH